MAKCIYLPVTFDGGTGFQELSADGTRMLRLTDMDGGELSAPAEYAVTGDAADVAWARDDDTPLPVVVLEEPVPESVTMAQARVALRHAGLLDKVTNSLKALPVGQRDDALIAWEYAPIVSRRGALVTSLAGTFDLSDTDLDGLFRAAAQVHL